MPSVFVLRYMLIKRALYNSDRVPKESSCKADVEKMEV